MSLTIDILQTESCEQPIYLRWKNLLGGYDYFMFEWSQDSKLNTTNGQQFKQNVSDLTTATEVYQYYKKQGREVLILFAENLNTNEVETIRNIALSPKVEMLELAGASPLVWFTVLIDQTDIGVYQTENKLHTLSFGIRLVELQTIGN